jgi:hypothetical protein
MERQITVAKRRGQRTSHWCMDALTHFLIPLQTFKDEEFIFAETITAIPHASVPLDLLAGEIRLVVLLPAENRANLYKLILLTSRVGNSCIPVSLIYLGTGDVTSELTLNRITFLSGRNLEETLRSLCNGITKTTI